MRIWSRLLSPAAFATENRTVAETRHENTEEVGSSLIRLDSNPVHSVQYAHRNQTLYVYFRAGRLYSYRDVPSELYREFLQTDSKETFFEQKIRRSFACERLSSIWVGETV